MVNTNQENKDIQDYKLKDVFIILISCQNKRSIPMSQLILDKGNKNTDQYVHHYYESFCSLKILKEVLGIVEESVPSTYP